MKKEKRVLTLHEKELKRASRCEMPFSLLLWIFMNYPTVDVTSYTQIPALTYSTTCLRRRNLR